MASSIILKYVLPGHLYAPPPCFCEMSQVCSVHGIICNAMRCHGMSGVWMTVNNCRVAHTERLHVSLRFALFSTLRGYLRTKYSARSSFVVFPFFVLFSIMVLLIGANVRWRRRDSHEQNPMRRDHAGGKRATAMLHTGTGQRRFQT
jgi:hypothetical protein